MTLKKRVEKLERAITGRRYMVGFEVGGTYTIDGQTQMTELEFLAWEKKLADNDHLIMVDVKDNKQ
jgi:hypothetical protein